MQFTLSRATVNIDKMFIAVIFSTDIMLFLCAVGQSTSCISCPFGLARGSSIKGATLINYCHDFVTYDDLMVMFFCVVFFYFLSFKLSFST